MTWITTDEKNSMLQHFDKRLLPVTQFHHNHLTSYVIDQKIKSLIMLFCPPLGNLEGTRLLGLFEIKG
jgi:hypothetical protein